MALLRTHGIKQNVSKMNSKPAIIRIIFVIIGKSGNLFCKN